MTSWEKFFREKIIHIFEENDTIIDIGGTLRVDKERGNRYDPNREWARPYIEKKKYLVLDPVPDYNPDIIGDIHDLQFEDNSQDAILCIAVLEHVENPIKACSEMYRVLKPGGMLFVYVPFLYPYHASPGYYGDYWRYPIDTINMLFKDFSKMEVDTVRGAFETWWYLSPFRSIPLSCQFMRMLDKLFKKEKTKQTSGYNVFLVK